MLVRTKEELRELIKSFPKELLNNPELFIQWHWKVEYRFAENAPFDITISPEDKKVTAISKVAADSWRIIPQGTLNSYEFQINSRGEMEVTHSSGTLQDAKAYYRETGKPSIDATSILDVSYTKSVYDKNGIEMATSSFSKYNWPLKGNRFEDDLKNQFRVQLLSEGWHKPKNWNVYTAVNIPMYVNQSTYVSGIIRNSENPALVETYSYELKTDGNYSVPMNRKSYLAIVHGEYPERLRVDEGNKYAEFDNGTYTLYPKDPDNLLQRPYATLEDAEKVLSIEYEKMLGSKLANTHDEDRRHLYQILLQRLEEYNKRYNREAQSR